MDEQGPLLSVTPLEDGPAVRAFAHAQQQVLAAFGVAAASRHVQIASPAMRLHVLEAGRGEPVVLIHGGGAVAVQLTPLLRTLQGSFQLFAPDCPGCGLSDRIDYRGVGLRPYIVQVIASLLDALNLPRASIVANVIGGYWALLFALAQPERVRKLVLVGEPAGSSPPQGPLPPRPAQQPPTFAAIRAQYAARLVAHIERVPDNMLVASHAAALIPGAAHAWETMLETIRQQQLGLTYALRPELAQLQPETLFLWGQRDTFGSPVLGHEMASLAPHARCEVVRDAGHLPFFDQETACGNLITAFLRE